MDWWTEPSNMSLSCSRGGLCAKCSYRELLTYYTCHLKPLYSTNTCPTNALRHLVHITVTIAERSSIYRLYAKSNYFFFKILCGHFFSWRFYAKSNVFFFIYILCKQYWFFFFRDFMQSHIFLKILWEKQWFFTKFYAKSNDFFQDFMRKVIIFFFSYSSFLSFMWKITKRGE